MYKSVSRSCKACNMNTVLLSMQMCDLLVVVVSCCQNLVVATAPSLHKKLIVFIEVCHRDVFLSQLHGLTFWVIFFKFRACWEYGNLRPVRRMSPSSEWGIVLHVNLLLCRIWHANNGSGAIFECRAGCKFSIANGHNFFFVNFLIKWNFRRFEHVCHNPLCLSLPDSQKPERNASEY